MCAKHGIKRWTQCHVSWRLQSESQGSRVLVTTTSKMWAEIQTHQETCWTWTRGLASKDKTIPESNFWLDGTRVTLVCQKYHGSARRIKKTPTSLTPLCLQSLTAENKVFSLMDNTRKHTESGLQHLPQPELNFRALFSCGPFTTMQHTGLF